MTDMTHMPHRSRQAAGQPTGGQFATEARGTQTGVSLSDPTGRTFSTPEFDADTVRSLVDEAWGDLPPHQRRLGHGDLLGRMEDLDIAKAKGGPDLNRILHETICVDVAPRDHDGPSSLPGTVLSETDRQAVITELADTTKPVAVLDVHGETFAHFDQSDWDRVCLERSRAALAEDPSSLSINRPDGPVGERTTCRTPFGKWQADVPADVPAERIEAEVRSGEFMERPDATFISAC